MMKEKEGQEYRRGVDRERGGDGGEEKKGMELKGQEREEEKKDKKKQGCESLCE